jgi:hypothetical protein
MSRRPHDIGELSSAAWFEFRARNADTGKTSTVEQLRTNSKLLRKAVNEIETLKKLVGDSLLRISNVEERLSGIELESSGTRWGSNYVPASRWGSAAHSSLPDWR